MSAGDAPPVRFPRLALVDPTWLAEHASLDDDAAELACEAGTADDFVDAFLEARRFAGLAKSLGFMLERREAVWMACVWARAGGFVAGVDSRARKAAEAWVRDPREDLRYKAFELAQGEQFDGPGAWAGLAAFWSGPSLSLPGNEPVKPQPQLTGVACAAVYAFASLNGPGAFVQGLVEVGLDIARGRNGVETLDALMVEVKAELAKTID
ncbi:MAG: hypothetical protein ACFB2Z_00675 [Maricaulaceae bacterium]